MTPRLKELYYKEIQPALKEKLLDKSLLLQNLRNPLLTLKQEKVLMQD